LDNERMPNMVYGMLPRLLFVIGVGVGALGGIGAGCTNAREEYESFNARLPDASPPIDAEIVSNVPDITGRWFIAARPPLNEDRFFFYISTATYTPVTENTGTLDWESIPLDFETLAVIPGYTYTTSDIDVRSDGTMEIPMVGTLPARNNSVTQSQVMIDAIIRGEVRTVDFLCGGLTGTAGSLTLDGSTFGAQRIVGDVLPTPIHRCEDGPSGAPDAGP